jgi:uncharacterized protein
MDIVVAFFLLGVLARLVRSDLRLPEVLYETLAIYLLLAIGLKGGIELSKQPVVAVAPQVLAVVAMGFAIPLVLYPVYRAARLTVWDAASLAGHYGSVSVVTFAVVTAALTRAGIAFEGHAAVWVAVLEIPGLVTGVLLARLMSRERSAAAPARWRALAHEVVFGKSVLLLVGGLAIGAAAGVAGTEPIRPFFLDLFKGVLSLFLLELGLVAGSRIADLRAMGVTPLAIGILTPAALSLVGIAVGSALGLTPGGVAILGTLAASASYIAAPTVMRIAVPQANSALTVTVALGVTFPFNLLVGIPAYIWLSHVVSNWRTP